MNGLLQSRKFWITIVDLVVSTASYFITKYVAPQTGNDVLWVIGMWQPVIIALITGIAIEDNGTNQAVTPILPASITVPASLTPTTVNVIPPTPSKLEVAAPVAPPEPTTTVTPLPSMVNPAVPDTLPPAPPVG